MYESTAGAREQKGDDVVTITVAKRDKAHPMTRQTSVESESETEEKDHAPVHGQGADADSSGGDD